MYHMFLRISMSMKLMVNIKEPISFQQQMFDTIFRRVFRKIAKSISRFVKCALCQSNIPMNFKSQCHLYNNKCTNSFLRTCNYSILWFFFISILAVSNPSEETVVNISNLLDDTRRRRSLISERPLTSTSAIVRSYSSSSFESPDEEDNSSDDWGDSDSERRREISWQSW